MKISLIILSILSLSLPASAQEDYFQANSLRYDNFIYKESIKTPEIHRKGHTLSYPVIELNTNDTIELTFDELSSDISDYYFTVIHCNSAWQPSGLSPSDFIDGFVENPVTAYKPSFNTLINYINYSIRIPDEYLRLKISGNYILFVYENSDKEQPVLTRRFFVTDTRTEITAEIKRATSIDLMKSHQEVDFNIKHTFRCNDPYGDIKVFVSQNYRSDNMITSLKPLFVKNNELIYNYEDGNLFPGGSEFRWFDAKSVRYQTERVGTIVYKKPYYNFYLLPDEKRTFKVYFSWQDINGKFFIKNSEGINSLIESDYVYVHFSLPWETPMVDGNIYVFGALSDWQCTKRNMLAYNYQKKCYELSLLLKQGFYDYEYVYLKDGANEADAGFIEGNHYETENEYLFFVYWKDISFNYEQLVGFKTFNSYGKK